MYFYFKNAEGQTCLLKILNILVYIIRSVKAPNAYFWALKFDIKFFKFSFNNREIFSQVWS